MDFLSNSDEKDKPNSDQPNNPTKPSKSELLHSAKVVADALKSQDFDKAKVAGAAADLLNAATEYGKLDDNEGMGKYVDMAENYLRKYHASNSTTMTTTTTDNPHHSTTTTAATESTHAPTDSDGHSKYGEYIKMAEGMLKKHSGGGSGDGASDASAAGHGNSSGGYGEYMKMAGDFMKKH